MSREEFFEVKGKTLNTFATVSILCYLIIRAYFKEKSILMSTNRSCTEYIKINIRDDKLNTHCPDNNYWFEQTARWSRLFINDQSPGFLVSFIYRRFCAVSSSDEPSLRQLPTSGWVRYRLFRHWDSSTYKTDRGLISIPSQVPIMPKRNLLWMV